MNICHLQLNEMQTLAIYRGAAPLLPADREAFYDAVGELLQGQVVGDGSVHRAIREAQSRFKRLQPEHLTPKWARER